MPRTFYRSVLQVEVLSEEPISEEVSLETVAEQIITGDWSGQTTFDTLNQQVDGPTMARLLSAQASDPGFFRLNPDGTDEED